MYQKKESRLLSTARRVLAFICAAGMVFSGMPASVLAEELEPPEQPLYSVEVLVKDKKDQPIEAAEVKLMLDEESIAEAITDNKGTAELEKIAAGTYQVTAKAEGFAEASVPVTVTDQNETAELTLEVETFSITAEDSKGGRIKLQTNKAAYDSDVTFEVEANEGYQLSSVQVNEKDVTKQLMDFSYTIKNVKENQVIKATFAKKTYSIKTSVGENGQLVQKDTSKGGTVYTINHGDAFDYIVKANKGYRIQKVLVDEEAVDQIFDNESTEYEGTISDVKKDHSIQATFVTKEYQVQFLFDSSADMKVQLETADSDGKGDEKNDKDKVYHVYGNNMNLVVKTPKGYTVCVTPSDDSVKVEETSQAEDGGDILHRIRITDIADDITLTVEMEPILYTVTGWDPLGEKKEWTYSVVKPLTLPAPEEKDGYRFVCWAEAVDGSVDAEKSVSEVAVDALCDMDVYAVWKIDTEQVNVKVDGNAYEASSGDTWYNGEVKITLETEATEAKWSYSTDTAAEQTVEMEENSLTIPSVLNDVVKSYTFEAKLTGEINEVKYSYKTPDVFAYTVSQDGQKPSVTLTQEEHSWKNQLEDQMPTNNLNNHYITDRITYEKDKYSVEISDSGSGIKKTEYQYVDFRRVKDLKPEELLTYLSENQWTDFTGTELTIEPERQGEWVLIVRATDYTDNKAYVDSSGTLFDTTAPEVSVQLKYSNAGQPMSVQDSADDIYSDGTITASVTVTDPMLVFSDKEEYERCFVMFGQNTLTASNTKLRYDTAAGMYVWTADFEISQALFTNLMDNHLTVQAIDQSGNAPGNREPQYTSGGLCIDTTAPVISIDYNGYASKTETAVYSSQSTDMVITITDDNLLRDAVVIEKTDTDGVTKKLDLSNAGYSQEDNKHIFNLSVTENSVYTVNAVDRAGIPAKETRSLELKFDSISPTITIDYSYSITEDGISPQAQTQRVVTDPNNKIDERECFNGQNDREENYSFDTIKARITVTDENGLNDSGEFAKNSIVVVRGVSGKLGTQNASVTMTASELNDGLNEAGTEWTGTITIPKDEYENMGDVQLYVSVKDPYGNVCVHPSSSLAIDTEAANITSVALTVKNDNPLAKAINFLTFGVFFNKSADLTIEYDDANEANSFDGSGVVAVQALVDAGSVDEAVNVDEEGKTLVLEDNTVTLTIPKEQIEEALEGGLTITTTDLVGNQLDPVDLTVKCEAAKNSYIMYEVTSPTISDNHTDEKVSHHDENSDSYWVLDGKSVTISTADAESGLNQVSVKNNAENHEDNISTIRESDNQKAAEVEADDNAVYAYGNLDAMTRDVEYTVAYDALDSDTGNSFVVTAMDNSNNGNKASGESVKIEPDDAGETEDYTFTVYKDTSEPMLDSLTLSGKGWKDDFNSLTFGSFFNEAVTVTAGVHDGEEQQASSGMAETLLTYAGAEIGMNLDSSDANVEGNTSTNAATTLSLSDGASVVESGFRIAQKDNVGNRSSNTIFDEDGTALVDTNLKTNSLMIETIKPALSNEKAVVFSEPTYTETDESKWYDSVDIQYSVPVEDKESGIRLVTVTLNGQQVTLPGTVWEYYQLDEMTNEIDIDFNLNELVNEKDQVVVAEGKNTLTVSVTDNAGNTSEVYRDTVYVDMTEPVVTGYLFDLPEYQDSADENGIANVVVETKYGYYFKKKVKVTAIVVDNALSSGIHQIIYKAVDKETGKTVVKGTAEKFDAVLNGDSGKCPANTEGSTSARYTFSIPANFKGQIYAYAVDHVGNYPVEKDKNGNAVLNDDGKPAPMYVSPDKAVVENAAKHKATSSISFEKAEAPFRTADDQELYSGNVRVTMNVEDLYSGISKVEWSLESPEDSGNNQSGVVEIDNKGKFSGDKGWDNARKRTDENLVTKISKTITVSNNSNDIVLRVRLTDRAGNTLEPTELQFSIDKTRPVIDVQYDNNNPDADNNEYFNQDRTAAITVTERNFNEADVALKLTNSLGSTPALSKWTKHSTAGGYDSDKDTYTATITFHDDGDYAFDLGFTDRAGNKADPFSDQFTIDETAPVMNVEFRKEDNTLIETKDEYAASAVTALISIEEHNFDSGRVTCSMTQDDATYPVNLDWSRTADTNSVAITLNEDAHYTFDLSSSDMAGNPADPYDTRSFYVDVTDPVITLSGIKKANSGRDGNKNRASVYPVIRVDDKYFTDGGVTFELTRANGEAITASGNRSDFLQDGQPVEAASGTYRFADLEEDDLYTLKVTATDLSGRVQSKMILDESMQDEDADRLNAEGGVEAYTFSLNRDGAVYVYSDDLKALVDSNNPQYPYYQHSILDGKDLTISAYDVEPLIESEIKLTINCDGHDLTDMQTQVDRQGHINQDGKYVQWYQYDFHLEQKDFKQDGRYTVSISDKDRLGNENNADSRGNPTISFTLDDTPPELNIVEGLVKEKKEDSQLKQVYDESLEVEYNVQDLFSLESLEIIVGDESQTITDFPSFSNYEGSITIHENAKPQTVRWVAKDKSGNTFDSSVKPESEVPFHRSVLVTKNVAAQWYYNTPLFVGTLVTIGSAAAIAIGAYVYKRRKEMQPEEEEV